MASMTFSTSVAKRSSESLLEKFISRLPEWGGFIKTNANQNLTNKIYNTCSIDYLLLAVWFSQQISNQSAQLLINLKEYNIIQRLINVIEFIENDEWNMAKTI